jgi:hypothetical protein
VIRGNVVLNKNIHCTCPKLDASPSPKVRSYATQRLQTGPTRPSDGPLWPRHTNIAAPRRLRQSSAPSSDRLRIISADRMLTPPKETRNGLLLFLSLAPSLSPLIRCRLVDDLCDDRLPTTATASWETPPPRRSRAAAVAAAGAQGYTSVNRGRGSGVRSGCRPRQRRRRRGRRHGRAGVWSQWSDCDWLEIERDAGLPFGLGGPCLPFCLGGKGNALILLIIFVQLQRSGFGFHSMGLSLAKLIKAAAAAASARSGRLCLPCL